MLIILDNTEPQMGRICGLDHLNSLKADMFVPDALEQPCAAPKHNGTK